MGHTDYSKTCLERTLLERPPSLERPFSNLWKILSSIGFHANRTCLERPPVWKDYFFLTSRVIVPDRFDCILFNFAIFTSRPVVFTSQVSYQIIIWQDSQGKMSTLPQIFWYSACWIYLYFGSWILQGELRSRTCLMSLFSAAINRLFFSFLEDMLMDRSR